MPKRRLALTRAKAARVQQRRQQVVRGKPLNHNARAESRYVDALTRLADEMIRVTMIEVRAMFRSEAAKSYFGQDESVTSKAKALGRSLEDRFEQLFGRSDDLASSMVSRADKLSKSNLHASLKELSGGLSLKTDIMTGPLRQSMQAMIADNVNLIRSIGSQYLEKVQGAVLRSITSGNGLQDLIPAIEQQGGIAKRRARNIALDQTRKAYNGINKARMQAVGVQKFEWLHSGGGVHPREDHIRLSGKVFSFDNLPIIDKRTGDRGIPGQAPNCRCRMIPVIDFGEDGEK